MITIEKKNMALVEKLSFMAMLYLLTRFAKDEGLTLGSVQRNFFFLKKGRLNKCSHNKEILSNIKNNNLEKQFGHSRDECYQTDLFVLLICQIYIVAHVCVYMSVCVSVYC